MSERTGQGPRAGLARRFALYFFGVAIGLVFLGIIQSQRARGPAPTGQAEEIGRAEEVGRAENAGDDASEPQEDSTKPEVDATGPSG